VSVSKVSKEDNRLQGAAEELGALHWTSPRICTRPELPTLEYGSDAENNCPAVTVKLAAEPIVAPAESRNVMVPVHDAAVPLDELEATLTTLI
jgi:hypothetical protein